MFTFPSSQPSPLCPVGALEKGRYNLCRYLCFTRVGDEKIVSAASTSSPGKAMSQDATLEKLAEILLDVRCNREAILVHVPTVGQPGFQMALHHLINRAALGLPAPICRCARSVLRLTLRTSSRRHNPIRE